METPARDVTDSEGTKGLEATFEVDISPESAAGHPLVARAFSAGSSPTLRRRVC